ncbi:ABC transporter substrate-binding protein [Cohnella silvisoli]|uniref:Extracellular solute-binding protein n=1 Tax=Cohnella silvisoli TaxID=2873699 RepID=A0ABV1KY09_9BACL|nr:extracellular solute-binding protein [Cohnella silvisoli]MCD9021866.1 extracellular solute-binding protein [Cohnella silvisoli]
MRRSRFLSVIALISMVVALAACGSNKSKGETASSPSATQSATTTTETGLKGELVYWSMWNENETQATVIKEAISAFEAENKDVKIKVQWNGRDNGKLIKPALDAGQQVDIFDSDNNSLSGFESYALKLDDYMTKAYASTNGKALKDALAPVFYNAMQVAATDGTSVYGMPYQPYMYLIPYNKALFAKAGITAAPQTWAEFMEACEKLKVAGITPLTVDDAYMGVSRMYHFSRYLGQEGVAKLVKDKTGAEWDNPTVLKAAKDIEELASKGYISKQVATNKFPAGQIEFANGSAAMYFGNGTWLPNEVATVVPADFQWGEFAFPAVDGGVQGREAAIYGTQCLVINNKSNAPDAAVAFAASLVTGKFDSELSKQTKGIAMGTDSTWAPELADAKAVFAEVTTQLTKGGGWDEDADKNAVVGANYIKLVTGKITAEEFVNNCKNNVK